MQETKLFYQIHESFSGYIVILALAIGIFLTSIISGIFTVRMNENLGQMIVFLDNVDSTQSQERIKSYKKLVNFNITMVCLNVLLAIVSVAKTAYGESLHYYNIYNQDHDWFGVSSTFAIGHIVVVIAYDFVVLMHPMVFIVFLPAMAKPLKRISMKISSWLITHICVNHTDENNHEVSEQP